MASTGESILVTGAAGFIGFHVAQRLCSEGHRVTGLDNLNPYYDVELKKARLKMLGEHPSFRFEKMELTEHPAVYALFEKERFSTVIHLAAQAGVRYSLQHPYAYLDSNLSGFLGILEAARHFPLTHLLFASSSSVYGANRKLPFSPSDNVDHPISLYAATKKANELMAHAYSALYNVPCTGLRFFTVYGPWGRPDMALFMFTKSILEGTPIDVFNEGKMRRDFTYVDDVVEGIVRLLPMPPVRNADWDATSPDPATSFAPYRVYNIGNSRPISLLDFIEAIENKVGKKSVRNLLPLQEGDVEETYADISALASATGFSPATPLKDGVSKFVDWYRDFYKK